MKIKFKVLVIVCICLVTLFLSAFTSIDVKASSYDVDYQFIPSFDYHFI